MMGKNYTKETLSLRIRDISPHLFNHINGIEVVINKKRAKRELTKNKFAGIDSYCVICAALFALYRLFTLNLLCV
jgi:tRNA-binding EMAP/Myf-like protein